VNVSEAVSTQVKGALSLGDRASRPTRVRGGGRERSARDVALDLVRLLERRAVDPVD
jgi:hypothetical protein